MKTLNQLKAEYLKYLETFSKALKNKDFIEPQPRPAHVRGFGEDVVYPLQFGQWVAETAPGIDLSMAALKCMKKNKESLPKPMSEAGIRFSEIREINNAFKEDDQGYLDEKMRIETGLAAYYGRASGVYTVKDD